MARRSTSKFTTVILSLPAGEELEVILYFQKNGQYCHDVGNFTTKAEQLETNTGRTVYLREFKADSPRRVMEMAKEDVERQLEPRIDYRPALLRHEEFKLPDYHEVLKKPQGSELTQTHNTYVGEYQGKYYTFVRPGHYPVSEGVELRNTEKVLVNRTDSDYKELCKMIDKLHESFYDDVCKLWETIEVSRKVLIKRFQEGNTPSPEQPELQTSTDLYSILTTYGSLS